jgi:hypothetical protein
MIRVRTSMLLATSALTLAALLACRGAPKTNTSQSPSPQGGTIATTTRDSASNEGVPWQVIFDGETLSGWHGFKTPGKAPAGWRAMDAELVRVAGGDHLVSDRTYANFELTLDWQIAENGNSGIFYRVDPTANAIEQSGPEMQVLDDGGHPDGQSRLTAAGSLYGLYPAPPGIVKQPGYWNSVRLLVDGAHVEHWLNGVKVVEYELWSPDWEAKVKASKFAAWPGYGRAQRGYIGLQDHGDRVAFRNIRIRELP